MEILLHETRPKYQFIYYVNVAGINRTHLNTKQRKYNDKQKNRTKKKKTIQKKIDENLFFIDSF